jgi:hypothetical protein
MRWPIVWLKSPGTSPPSHENTGLHGSVRRKVLAGIETSKTAAGLYKPTLGWTKKMMRGLEGRTCKSSWSVAAEFIRIHILY